MCGLRGVVAGWGCVLGMRVGGVGWGCGLGKWVGEVGWGSGLGCGFGFRCSHLLQKKLIYRNQTQCYSYFTTNKDVKYEIAFVEE